MAAAVRRQLGPIEYGLIREILREELREELKVATIFVENTLDQDVTVQIKGNRVKSLDGAIDVGSAFTVPAGKNDARTLTPDTSGWLPYLTVQLSCAAAPTTGSVTVYRIRGRGDEVKVVDALEIRDTNTHDPSTDPDKIFMVEW